MNVGIVGGGITGLALHHHLRRTGVESTVFEAAAEPGGVVGSTRVDGRTLELGPQRTRLSPPVASLVEAVGIGDAVVEAADRPLYVYYDGRLRRVPFTLREAVTTDLLSWRGKARVLLEPLTGPPRDDETVREFVARTLGPEVADRVVGPLYGGIYGSHPDEMYARHSLARALRKRGVSRSTLVTVAKARLRGSSPPPVVTFEGGLQALPEALYQAHEDGVELETPVEAVGEADAGFEVETASGTDVFDAVVLTTPADVTADVVAPVAPEAAGHLRRLSYNPLALVHLAADDDLDASGYQVQFDESLRTLGVTCNGSLFGTTDGDASRERSERDGVRASEANGGSPRERSDRDGVYTCFLGGWKTPDLVEWSDERIRETAVEEFEAVTGFEARPLHVHRLPRGMPAYDTSWTALEQVELPDGVHLCANYESRAGIPGRIARARRLAETLAAE